MIMKLLACKTKETLCSSDFEESKILSTNNIQTVLRNNNYLVIKKGKDVFQFNENIGIGQVTTFLWDLNCFAVFFGRPYSTQLKQVKVTKDHSRVLKKLLNFK